jgi:hypothetical protein
MNPALHEATRPLLASVTDDSSRKFAAISRALREVGLWCFPIAFKRNGNHYDKKPIVRWKPFQERPPTEAELITWNTRFRNAGGGIPTGPGTAVIVIDGDTPQAIEYLEIRGMPETWLVRTHRGLHYYFQYPSDFEVHNSASEIAPNVDVRAIGGFVVAAGSHYAVAEYIQGSVAVSTFTYEYEPRHSPQDLPLADLPKWLSDELRKRLRRTAPIDPPALTRPYSGKIRAWSRRAFDGNLSLLSDAVFGTRNTTLFSVARRLGQLAAGGELKESEILDAMVAIWSRWTNEDPTHSRDTMERAFAFGKLSPRSAPNAGAKWTTDLTGEEIPGADLPDELFWDNQLGRDGIDHSFWG